ncbi:MAG: Crp/Fnr family transcriptional regulator [Bacteroidetes bacterium]|nr:Crp/Fnr family transcriptional regulator [Bacteroidota bacterium]MBK6840208.1 Crp/Fnr family transcriptional regulator [Bacteroidota bacterium]
MTTKSENDPLKENFNQFYHLSDKSFTDLKSIFRYSHREKGEVFIRVGYRNESEYMILNGFCRSFLLNPEGEEITLSFFKQNSVLSPHITRTKEQISLLNYQALTDVDLVEFSAAEFLNLMIENLEIRNFGNTILVNELIRKTEKEISFASLTAKDRLIQFRSEYGILENLIAHPVIASYLGITNVSFSRLRGELSKGE